MWTPLHTALGSTDGTLTFQLVADACIAQIAERADLDWKRTLPLTATEPDAKRAQQLELAKDLAAMANSGGGMVVYGVDETRHSDQSVASSICDVGTITDSTLTPIRQTASNLIYPPITDLELVPLASASLSDHVLVVLVPDSPDAPHLIHPAKGQNDWFAAPWRNGPTTEWMKERSLARAFVDRDLRRKAVEDDLNSLWSTLGVECGAAANDVWVLAVARPERPHPRPREMTAGTAHALFKQAATGSGDPQDRASAVALTASAEITTRRGLRKFWRAISLKGTSARAEIHADGTVAIATRRTSEGFAGDAVSLGGEVAVPDMEQACLDIACLIAAVRRRRIGGGDYLVQIGIAPSTQIFRRASTDSASMFAPWNEAERIPQYPAIRSTLIMTQGRAALLDSTMELIEDVANQAGTIPSIDHLTASSLLCDG